MCKERFGFLQIGKLDCLFTRLMVEPDWQWLFIDGSHIRVHQHGTGIADQAIGKGIPQKFILLWIQTATLCILTL